ncbi:MAG: hypothetical protein AAB421_05130 [Patescibacteria group bacterium]
MFVVHVYPVLRGTPLERLSYFSREAYARGSLIEIPIRKKIVTGIVARSEPVAHARGMVRTSDFAFAKLPPGIARHLCGELFVDAIEQVSAKGTGTPGALLASLLPQALLAEEIMLAPCEKRELGFEEQLLQRGRTERFDIYRTLAREAMARSSSLVVIVPTAQDVEALSLVLSTGLPESALVKLHAALPKKILRETMQKTARSAEPLLMVATPSFVWLTPPKTAAVVIEREASDHYHRDERPYADMRDIVRAYARTRGVTLICADSVLSIATRHSLEQGTVAEHQPLTHSIRTTPHTSLVDMREYKTNGRGEFIAVSRELAQVVKDIGHEQSRLFILSGRRGLASSVICGDCGLGILCKRCGASMTLHTAAGKKDTPTKFLCHHCRFFDDSEALCTACTSWNLKALGAGSELVEKQIRAITTLPVFRLDSDTAKTPKSAQKITHDFLSQPSIMVGTAQALAFLPERIPHSAVVAIDSLLSVPDYSIEEKLFGLITSLIERTEKSLLVQTRSPDQATIRDALGGRITEFHTRERAQREQFGFPPFAALVTIGRFGNRQTVTRDMALIMQRFSPFSPVLLPARLGKDRGTEAFISIPKKAWPHTELLAQVRSLPPSFRVQIRLS